MQTGIINAMQSVSQKQAKGLYFWLILHCELKKNWATFIFTVILANVDRFQ